MKILVVDDEALARRRLIRLLEDIDGCELVAEAGNGSEALKLSSEYNPEIVLLDIRMPEMDGLEAAAQLNKLPNPPAIIFTTAFGDHALQAFEANAIAYLLKPIRREKLREAVMKATRLNKAQLNSLQQDTPANQRAHLTVNIRGNLQLIPVDDIICFIADQKYTRLIHDGGEALIEDSLATLETEFADRLLRIHRNALIMTRRLSGIRKDDQGGHQAQLQGTDLTPEISRRLLPGIRKMLKEMS